MNIYNKLELFIGALYFFICYAIFNYFNNGILQIGQIIFLTFTFLIIYFSMKYFSNFIIDTN